MKFQKKKLPYNIYSLLDGKENIRTPLPPASFEKYLRSFSFIFSLSFLYPNKLIIILTPHIRLRHSLFFETVPTLPGKISHKDNKIISCELQLHA